MRVTAGVYMKRRKKGSEEGGWLNTYADMVTLLLCFFVLLYSISSVDKSKWENLVISLNPDAAEALNEPHSDGTETEGTLEKLPDADAFEEIAHAVIPFWRRFRKRGRLSRGFSGGAGGRTIEFCLSLIVLVILVGEDFPQLVYPVAALLGVGADQGVHGENVHHVVVAQAGLFFHAVTPPAVVNDMAFSYRSC